MSTPRSGEVVRVVRVVAVSPGDVMRERERLAHVVEELNRGIASERDCRLALWRWETDAHPGIHLHGPQGLIDDAMRIEEADIVVGIFWTRFGTPTLGSGSGTEHELRRAWSAWGQHGRPDVLVYFCERVPKRKRAADDAQMQQLQSFRAAMPEQQLWWTYSTPGDFERKVREDLIKLVLAMEPSPDPASTPARFPSTKWALAATAAILIGVALAVAILTSDVTTSSSGARPRLSVMTGDLNIAVAPFTANGHASVDGASLARDTYRVLRSQLAGLDPRLRTDIIGPDENGDLVGLDQSRRTTAPGRLAQDLKADLIVYGDLDSTAGATRLTPHFYLNGRKLPSAAELVGSYSYGRPIEVPFGIDVNPQARAEIRDTLIRRTTGFATIFVGVGYYLTHQLPRAGEYFKKAISQAPDEPTRALLELFLGNIANQEHKPALAARHYKEALGIAPRYARALFGLAEVQYALAHGSCARDDVDLLGMYRARDGFMGVPVASLRKNSARAAFVLGAKVRFGLGQVDLCLSHAGIANRWALARAEFSDVIRLFGSSHAELRDDAAEAHAGIGLSDLGLGTQAGYLAARREYQAAADTTTSEERRAFFYGMIAFASSRVGDRVGATRAYLRAAGLTRYAPSKRRFEKAAHRNVHR